MWTSNAAADLSVVGSDTRSTFKSFCKTSARYILLSSSDFITESLRSLTVIVENLRLLLLEQNKQIISIYKYKTNKKYDWW